MEKIVLNTNNNTSNILIGESLKNLSQYIPKSTKTIIITDSNILKHYKNDLGGFEIIKIGQGEDNKTLKTIDYIMNRLVELEADRKSFIVGIGGGIVCDVTGFAASIYLRGVRFGFVSTTLLSQVDASVGGKNGVNHKGYKNMIGVFNQPNFVICDINMLKTLDRTEFIGGFAEVIKHGCIRDISLFEFLENNSENALNYDTNVIERCVRDSVVIKSRVVENDEKESGERRILNFGHTFGHAIEKITKIHHGYAVAIGMVYAAKLSNKLGLIKKEELERIINVIKNFHLPIELDINKNKLFSAMKKDKKREGDSINFVLLGRIGNAIIKDIKYEQLESLIYDLY